MDGVIGNANEFLIAGYLLVWVSFAGFGFSLFRKLKKIKREIRGAS